MKLNKEVIWWIWAGFISLSIVGYFVYVMETADRKQGCTYSQEECVSGHTEESTHWQPGFGKYSSGHWVTSEDYVCDDYETVTYQCDCITYHWFWGDYKNYNESNESK